MLRSVLKKTTFREDRSERARQKAPGRHLFTLGSSISTSAAGFFFLSHDFFSSDLFSSINVGPLSGTSELAICAVLRTSNTVLFPRSLRTSQSPNERGLSPPFVENEDLHSHVCFRHPRSYYLVACTFFCLFVFVISPCFFLSQVWTYITNLAWKIHTHSSRTHPRRKEGSVESFLYLDLYF